MMQVKDLPIGMYGAVMGLVGLGLSARSAAPVLPGVVQAPAYFTEPWILLGVLAFLFLMPAYCVKVLRYPRIAHEEFTNPAKLGFCGALPVGLFLLGGGVGAYLPLAGSVLWWSGFVLLLVYQVWAIAQWLKGGVELAHINAGWLIILVGGIVAPGPGIELGHIEASRFIFGVSASAAPLLMALLFFRAVAGPPLPEALRPTWFILLVPPSLIYANGIALYPGLAALELLFPAALVLAVALLVLSRGLLAWPFGPPWWAFTFPLDALAYGAARYAQDHPSPLWKGVCAATLALATLFVLLVLWKTLRSAASRPA